MKMNHKEGRAMKMNQREMQIVMQIADRAADLYQRLGLVSDDQLEFVRNATFMEVAMVHKFIVPLRLEEMLEADDGNFGHDVGGIHRHLDFGTKKSPPCLSDCFLPRFAVTS